MKLLIIAPDFYPSNGGYSNAITNFVNELSKNDLDIFVYTPRSLGEAAEINVNNVKVIRRDYFKYFPALLWEIYSFFKVKTIIKKNNVDIILFETAEFGLMGYLTANFFPKTLVRIHACTETGVAVFSKMLYEKIAYYFTRLFFNKVEYILSTNNYHIEFYKEYFAKKNIFKIAKKKFFVVPNIAPDLKKINNTLGRKDLFEKYQMDYSDNVRLFFTLGRLNSVGLMQKGMEDLVYAVFLLKNEDENIYGNIRIFLVGKGENKNYLIKLTKDLGIKEKFVFLDEMVHDEVLNFMNVSDCVVLLSRFEGLSMFALEALSCGSLLLFSKSGGIKDLVLDNKNGYLVDTQDVDMIKEKIKEIILKNPAEISEMKRKSINYYNNSFRPEKSCKKFIAVLNLIKNI